MLTEGFLIEPNTFVVGGFIRVSSNNESVTKTFLSKIEDLSLNSIIESKNTYTAFPNPSSDVLTIELNGNNALPSDVRIFDLVGNEMSETKIYKSNGSIVLTTELLPTGTYIARICTGDQHIVKSFVIAR